jgi:hypothetical protein
MSTKKFALAGMVGLAVGSAAMLTPRQAEAALVQVGSRAALGSNLAIDWSAFGPAGTNLSCFCEASVGPLGVHINSSSGLLNRYDEGTDYTGNFALGDALLSHPYVGDEMTIGFSAPVEAVGTQIQPGDYIGAFTGYIEVLTNDGMDAFFSVAGDSTAAEDNSAPFIGVTSTVADITGMHFFVDTGNPEFPKGGALAINELDVTLPTAVPEPSSLLLMASALLAALPLALRRKRG